MKFYKVVSSMRSVTGYGKYEIEYKEGEWVKTKIGKIFVFSSLAAARAFAKNSICFGSPRIYEVEVKNAEPAREIAFFTDTKSIRRFWNGVERGKAKPIDGTWLCDSVKLVKQEER